MHHVFVAGAWVRRDEIRNQVLLLSRLGAVFVEHLLEAVIRANAWLHHHGQRTALGVFGRNFQIAAHMVGHQLFHILGAFDCQVVTQA